MHHAFVAKYSICCAVSAAVLCIAPADAQSPRTSDPATGIGKEYVLCDDAVMALTNVRVVDGTGRASHPHQTLIIRNGKIATIGDTSSTPTPDSAKVLNLAGRSVIPGLVGMHEHLFYTSALDLDAEGRIVPHLSEIAFTAPRLYLAAGVTTIRTTGSIEPYADLDTKKQIDAHRMVGPKMDVTSPYLEGSPRRFPQMHELTGPDDARRMVAFWADAGATSFKAYTHITHSELAAAIEEAHKRHLKVTAHLCSIGWREAAALGIDDFAHGPISTDSEFVIGKQPDQCPDTAAIWDSWVKTAVSSASVKALIRDLVNRGITITSTIANAETITPGRPDPATAGPGPIVARIASKLPRTTCPRSSDGFRAGSTVEGRFHEGNAIRIRLCEGGRLIDGWIRPNRYRRHCAGLRESARSRASGRGRFHAPRSDPHRHV